METKSTLAEKVYFLDCLVGAQEGLYRLPPKMLAPAKNYPVFFCFLGDFFPPTRTRLYTARCWSVSARRVFPSFLGDESGSLTYVEHRVQFELVEHEEFEERPSPSALVQLGIILYLFGHVGPGRWLPLPSLHVPGRFRDADDSRSYTQYVLVCFRFSISGISVG